MTHINASLQTSQQAYWFLLMKIWMSTCSGVGRERSLVSVQWLKTPALKGPKLQKCRGIVAPTSPTWGTSLCSLSTSRVAVQGGQISLRKFLSSVSLPVAARSTVYWSLVKYVKLHLWYVMSHCCHVVKDFLALIQCQTTLQLFIIHFLFDTNVRSIKFHVVDQVLNWLSINH